MSYYNDGRITFDEAESLLEAYITEMNTASTATSKEIAQYAEVEESRHNLYRIHEALSKRFEETRSNRRPKRYKIAHKRSESR